MGCAGRLEVDVVDARLSAPPGAGLQHHPFVPLAARDSLAVEKFQ